MRNVKLSWAVFIVLGAAMYLLRYRDILSTQQLGMLRDYAPFVVLGIHIVLVLQAFHDSIFQGILALLIPFYSFYWLFIVSDSFMLRAVVSGLLIGFGQDALFFYNDFFGDIIVKVHKWIASGGGEVKRY